MTALLIFRADILFWQIASLQNLSTCTEKDELYIMMELVDTDLHRLIQSKTKLEEAHIAYVNSVIVALQPCG